MCYYNILLQHVLVLRGGFEYSPRTSLKCYLQLLSRVWVTRHWYRILCDAAIPLHCSFNKEYVLMHELHIIRYLNYLFDKSYLVTINYWIYFLFQMKPKASWLLLVNLCPFTNNHCWRYFSYGSIFYSTWLWQLIFLPVYNLLLKA